MSDATCPTCHHIIRNVTGYVHDDDGAFAVYMASLHHHQGEHTAWIDVIMGAWGEDEPVDDRVTFGCRVGAIPGHEGPQCSLVSAASERSDSDLFGRKLDRTMALEHPWLADFWSVVDHVLLTDPDAREFFGVIEEHQ